jgi:hypothetical protein
MTWTKKFHRTVLFDCSLLWRGLNWIRRTVPNPDPAKTLNPTNNTQSSSVVELET